MIKFKVHLSINEFEYEIDWNIIYNWLVDYIET